MKKIYILLLILGSFQFINAQYTEIINSKRPGFAESPYSVGTDVFQFETGIFYKNSNTKDLSAVTKSTGGNLFFRYGKFYEKLEFNAKITYQNNELLDTPNPNYHVKGISELTIGAKYLIFQQEFTDKSKEIRSWKRRMAYDKKRLIPSVGIYAGVNTNFLGEGFKDDGISYKAAVLLQNDFTDRFVVVTNLIANNISSENNYYKHIITATYAINNKWSFFVENQARYQKKFNPKVNNGAGLAYLFNRNLQLDASIRTNFFEDYSFSYSSIGAAWRFDRHSDEISKTYSPRDQIMKKRKRKKRGNIFSRMFNKN